MYYPREAEKDHLYNRVILLTFACCVLLGLAAMARQQGAVYAAIHWSAVEVTGTVTQVEAIPRNDTVKLIHYRYVDGDGRAHEDQCWDKRYDEHAPYAVGQDISLVYSRWLPQVSSITTVLRSYRPGFYIMASGILLTLLFLGISFKTLGRISTLKREDQYY